MTRDECIRRADPEALYGVLRALQEEYPLRTLSLCADSIDWESVRFAEEGVDVYRDRAIEITRRRTA